MSCARMAWMGWVVAAAAVPAAGQVFTVTTTADSGSGSLRQAILDANAFAGAATIDFTGAALGGPILLGSELPIITNRFGLTVQGNGAIIDGGATSNTTGFRVFFVGVASGEAAVSPGLTATTDTPYAFQELTIRNANARGGAGGTGGAGGGGGLGAGGAVFVRQGASLTVVDGSFSGDFAVAGAGGSGASPGQAIGGTLFLAGSAAFSVSAGNTVTVGNTIGCGADPLVGGGLTKTGAGLLVLTRGNSYVGGTVVDEGTLRLENDNGSATGTGAVTVADGGTLAGFGSAQGVVTVQGGGRIAPGRDGSDALTIGGLLGSAGGVLDLELDGPAPGPGYDQLAVDGTVDLGGMTLAASLTYDPASGDVLVILDNDGTDPVIGTFAGLAGGSTFVVGGYQATISYFGGTGNDVVLSGFTPIPEPPAVAGLLLVAAAATVIRLRRR